jgi:hypothetical protein
VKVIKERLTVHLSLDLIDRLKNAVFWTPGMTMAALVEDAVRQAIDRMEKQRGEPFETRTGMVRRGRPPK